MTKSKTIPWILFWVGREERQKRLLETFPSRLWELPPYEAKFSLLSRLQCWPAAGDGQRPLSTFPHQELFKITTLFFMPSHASVCLPTSPAVPFWSHLLAISSLPSSLLSSLESSSTIFSYCSHIISILSFPSVFSSNLYLSSELLGCLLGTAPG